MKANLEIVKSNAKYFLALADRFNAEVSNFINGSNARHDAYGYGRVKAAYKNFILAYNAYYNERVDDSIDYELAESIA